MNCSDWISIICAGVSLVVTIIIACLQFWQSSRINKFERRQDERDEQRHAESVKAQAVSFISKHYSKNYSILFYTHCHILVSTQKFPIQLVYNPLID